MRSYDSWNRYLDNNGNPLHGCVQFMVKDGTTIAPIYDADGTALDNPQITDIYGRTAHQVFIDVDVRAYFYSYIGNGIWNTQLNIDTSDQTKWALQYTIENQNSMSRVIESTGLTCVPNINALRELVIDDVPVINGIKAITLLGYYELGDKEPINYYWDPECSDNDDDGSIIKYVNEITGRWIMVQPTEHCDSRHFGVFPSNSYNMDDQTYGIIKLVDYCNKKSIRPFFNGSEDYRWFKYTNLNINVDTIDVSDGIRFYDLGNNFIDAEWNGNPNFSQHNTNLTCKNVKTSWGAKSYTGATNAIIDVDTDQKNWSNCHINIQYTPCYGYNFDHCTFEDNGNIGSDNVNGINNTFTNCKLNERMFILDGANQVSLTNLCLNCQIDPDDFRNSMWLYKQIRCTSDGNHFFDYRDFPNVGKPYDSYVGNKLLGDTVWVTNLKNLIANKVSITKLVNQTTIVFENCIGWYEIPSNMIVVSKNSTLKLSLGDNVVINADNSTIDLVELPQTITNAITATFKDSIISGVAGYYHTFNANLCTVSCPMDVTNCSFYNSIISSNIRCGYADVKDSTIAGQFNIYGLDQDSPIIVEDINNNHIQVNRIIAGNLTNNFVSGQIEIGTIDYQDSHFTAQDLVRGLTISYNVGISVNPITVHRSMTSVYDNYNIYEYKANTGTMEMKESGVAQVYQSATQWPATQSAGFITGMYNNSIRAWTLINEDPTLYENAYAYKAKIFTIGTYNINQSLKINLTSSSGQTTAAYLIGNADTTVTSDMNRDKQLRQAIKLNSGEFDWGIKFSHFGNGYVQEAGSSNTVSYNYTVIQD